jgi:FtsH-binding integral membrane protein
MTQSLIPDSPFRSDSLSPSQQLAQSSFLNRTYGWMFVGLLVTAAASMFVASNENAVQFIFGNRWVFYGLLLAEIALVFGLSAAINRISAGAATLGFLVYSVLNGVTFSAVFLIYQLGSIGEVFALSAGMFGALALFGTVTKKNLSGIGTFMMMGLFGIILLGLINIFVKSDAINFAFSIAGIIIFSGLTAYDAQRIQLMAKEYSGTGMERKGAILGALALYLDFINLFLSLLRLIGRRRN